MKKIIAMIVIGLVIVLGVTAAFLQRTLNRVPENPPTYVGNTPGNINNGGVFVALGDKFYFANPYDNDYLYQMDTDLSHVEKVMDVPVSMLNGAEGYLYYYQDISRSRASGSTGLGYIANARSLTRLTLNGRHTTGLETAAFANIILEGNYLYAENYDKAQQKMNLMRVSLDGKEKEVIADFWINPAGAEGGYLYYNGTGKDHFLYSLNTQTLAQTPVYAGDVWYPTPDGGYIYYLNVADEYRLYRIRLSDQTPERVTEDSVDLFNVKDGVVFYSRMNGTPALMRTVAGSGYAEMISDGAFEKISMVGNYAFFRSFGTPSLFYCYINGPAQLMSFSPAVVQ